MDIRLLKPSEIECRVQSTKKTAKGTGCIMLLYKDARCDMKILDEVFGNMGWQRTHEVINGNLFCNIEVWDTDKNQWIKKQDVGTESNTEKEKGQASDSFKRACFNLGIGRELYTSPFIWINLNDGETSEYNGKTTLSSFVKFNVKSIGYNEDREINALEIEDNKKVVRFKLGATIKPTESLTEAPTQQGHTETPPTEKEVTVTTQMLLDMAKSKGFDEAAVCKRFKTKEAKFIKQKDKQEAYENFKKLPDKEVK